MSDEIEKIAAELRKEFDAKLLEVRQEAAKASQRIQDRLNAIEARLNAPRA